MNIDDLTITKEDAYPTGMPAEDSAADYEAVELPEGLRGFSRLKTLYGQENNKPAVVIKKENARHRRILYMKAHGMSNRDIAEVVQMSPVSIGLITRQEWFKAALVQLMNACGIDGVKQVIQGAAIDSVYKVIQLRDAAKSEAVQRDCAFDILDRYLGKAVQPIGETNKKPVGDEMRLDSEISELQKKLGITGILAQPKN